MARGTAARRQLIDTQEGWQIVFFVTDKVEKSHWSVVLGSDIYATKNFCVYAYAVICM